MDTHDPYDAPEPYNSMFFEPGEEQTQKIQTANYSAMAVNAGKLELTPEEFDLIRKKYDGALRYADRNVKTLLDYLDENGLRENTLIIVCSDHGEVFGRWGLLTHNTLLYRPLIHIPLIISHPGLVKEPRVVDEIVSIENIFHTITKLLGIAPSDTTGLPVRDLLAENITPGSAFSMFRPSESNKYVNRYENDGWSLWTDENMHYILFEKETWECYDLTDDFDEYTNICPGSITTDSLESAIFGFRDRLFVFKETEEDFVISRDLKTDENKRMEILKSLGYIGDSEEEDEGLARDASSCTRPPLESAIFSKKKAVRRKQTRKCRLP